MKAMYDKKRKEYDHLITNLQDSGNVFIYIYIYNLYEIEILKGEDHRVIRPEVRDI